MTAIDSVTTALREPTGLSNRSPSLVISWDPARLHITGEELADELARNKPRIAVGSGGGRGAANTGLTSISVTAWMMQPGDDKAAAERIHGVQSQKRSPRPTASAAATADLTGRWNVEVEFFSSTRQHTLVLEQDGNWLHGSHQGDFTVRDLFGRIEGNQVLLRSTERRPGANVTFTFAGTASGNTISGPLYMGEYLDARFTARRHQYPDPASRPAIRVPGGRPLAT